MNLLKLCMFYRRITPVMALIFHECCRVYSLLAQKVYKVSAFACHIKFFFSNSIRKAIELIMCCKNIYDRITSSSIL